MVRFGIVGISRLVFLCAISTTAHAAFGQSFKSVPVSAILFTLVLSTLSGIVALLNRIRDELRNHGTLRYPGIFITSHMTGSWLAGELVFIIGLGNDWPDWTVAGAIIGASFLGAVFIERVAVKWISQKLGVDITKPAPLDPPITRFEDTRPKQQPTLPPDHHYGAPSRRRREFPPLVAPAAAPKPTDSRSRRDQSPSDFTPFDESG
jgi:hypothetical protein